MYDAVTNRTGIPGKYFLRTLLTTVASLAVFLGTTLSLPLAQAEPGGSGAQDPAENIARNKTVFASSKEAESVRPALAVDGNTTDRGSRWGSNTGSGPEWIYVDFGSVKQVKTVKVFWETRKATSYKIQIASQLSAPMNEGDWTNVYEGNDRPKQLNETITLKDVQQARYLRLLIPAFTATDPDGAVEWNTISIYELEAYGGAPEQMPRTLEEVANGITVKQPQKGDKKLEFTAPSDDAFTIKYNGTDLEQVIAADQTIYTPIVAKTVKASFKIIEKKTGKYLLKEIPVTVPGSNEAAPGDNPAPKILPELQEWKGNSGVFTLTGRIVYKDQALKNVATSLADDYAKLTGKKIPVTQGTSTQKGDVFLSLNTGKAAQLGTEGYLMNVADALSVEASENTGAYWATRTILQSIKATGNLPKGVTRDYPTYKVRGFILDVGRKTFTLDFLKEIVQQMSWYKMNDFHVHLNDNYIFLEQLQKPMEAYSGFRLESDIKAGGNGGKNKADLTSKDVWYSKADFRSFIKDSRNYGVNIVPEFDTPAHSLAFTKVRPDLRTGTNGRENDHLDLKNQYDESSKFVKEVFNEYINGNNPVFDGNTTIHVGADEYTADKEAYRKFSDDILKYVKASGRTPRIWGSLNALNGTTPVTSQGVQMNIWSTGWANPKDMYDQGFDLINSLDGSYYIVPNSGYYHPNGLDEGTLYNQAINNMAGTQIPAGDPQMLGAAFAVWNDMTGPHENGVTQYDVYKLTENAFPLMGAKLWGKGNQSLQEANQTRKTLGDAPQTNFNYQVASKGNQIMHLDMEQTADKTGNGYDLADNTKFEKVDGDQALKLAGNNTCVPTKLDTVGLGNDLRVKVKRTDGSNQEQVLFSSSYGQIKAVQKDTGKVGFSRENRDYSFAYSLPINEWVELEFKNHHKRIELYVNGSLVDTIGDDESVKGNSLIATFMFPLECIGAKTGNAFSGYIDDIRLGKNNSFNSTMELDYLNAILEAINPENPAVKQAQKVIAQYAPNKADIDEAVAKVKKEIAQQDYEKADYSRLDQISKAIPADLSPYTAESVANLNQALKRVRRGLPKAMQATVDGYEQAVTQARAALKIDVSKNADYLQCDQLTATASSQETAQENNKAANAVDCNPSTIWHSAWNKKDSQYWLNLKLPEENLVSGFEYTPRPGGGNGNVTKYKIQVSSDGNTYSDVSEGVWEDNTQVKTVSFTPHKASHLRLVVVSGKAGFASAGEVRVKTTKEKADKEGLQAAVDATKNLKEASFTSESWKEFQTALTAAKQLLSTDTPGVKQVEDAKSALAKAVLGLQLTKKSLPDGSGSDQPKPGKPDPSSPPVKPGKDTNPRETDSDKDGITDNKDKCPDTAKGVKVDANGCALTGTTGKTANHNSKSGSSSMPITGNAAAVLAILSIALTIGGITLTTLRRKP